MYTRINEAILFGVDRCFAGAGSLVSSEFFNSTKKMPLVDYSERDPFKRAFKMEPGHIQQKLPVLTNPTKVSSLTPDLFMKTPHGCCHGIGLRFIWLYLLPIYRLYSIKICGTSNLIKTNGYFDILQVLFNVKPRSIPLLNL